MSSRYGACVITMPSSCALRSFSMLSAASLRHAASAALRNGAIGANISVFTVFYGQGWRFFSHTLDQRNRRTLANRNLTAGGAKRILNFEALRPISCQ